MRKLIVDLSDFRLHLYFRIESWKHNPYVGSFHAINYAEGQATKATNGIMLESKNNPLVGFVRHSPSISKSMGLKRIISEDPSIKPPILTQLQLKRNELASSPLTEKNFVRSLKQIPTSVYSSSEIQSPSRRGSIKLDENSEDQCLCAICMEAYVDGDEIVKLACDHCYHGECATKWFYQDVLNSTQMESNFSCPKCRKSHHTTLSEVGTSSSFVTTEDILDMSTTLLQIGQSLIHEGGYDFLSDFGGAESPYDNNSTTSETRFVPKSPYRISPTKCIQRQKSSSTINSGPSSSQPLMNQQETESNEMNNNNTQENNNNINTIDDCSSENYSMEAFPITTTTTKHVLMIPPQVIVSTTTRSMPKPVPSPVGSVLSLSAWSDCSVPL